MTGTRRYVSPTREAKAAATRDAIVQAFVDQMSKPGWETLSPTEAAKEAGVSVRTVHNHFPDRRSQVDALAEWFQTRLPGSVKVAQGPDDLARYYHEIHAWALESEAMREYAKIVMKWPELRQRRRVERLDAIRRAVAAIGASKKETEEATALLLSMSGADFSWTMHELYGLPLARIPGTIASTVQLVVDELARAVSVDQKKD